MIYFKRLFFSQLAKKIRFTVLPSRTLTWERDSKSGYGSKTPPNKKIEMIKEGFGMLKGELKLWKEEVTEKLRDDPKIMFQHGDYDIIWNFDSHAKLEKWIVTNDSDHNEGKSESKLILSKNKKGLFFGTLNTEIPKDGKIKKAGYCNIKSIRAYKSFKRETSLDWSMFTHLMLKVRGDGRTYMINIGTAGYYDITWNDIYNYPLYTRGGPYWQMSKIPFSKFFLSSKGRIQDKQAPLPLRKITSIGITCGDKNNGPFNLEVDYIGIYYDANHHEEFAYEMYQLPKFYIG